MNGNDSKATPTISGSGPEIGTGTVPTRPKARRRSPTGSTSASASASASASTFASGLGIGTAERGTEISTSRAGAEISASRAGTGIGTPRTGAGTAPGTGTGTGTGTGNSTLLSHRSASSMSSASNDSHDKRQQQQHQQSLQRPSTAHSTSSFASTSTSNLNLNNGLTNFSRPQPRQSIDAQMRMQSPPGIASASGSLRPRQHSQGFFEPSLPHATTTNVNTLGSLTASQIAAQTAMHHIHSSNQLQQPPPHPQPQSDRRRPSPALTPINVAASRQDRRVVSPSAQSPPPMNMAKIDDRLAATTAANAAFPRSPLPSPHAFTADQPVPAPPAPIASPNPEMKTKESRSKMKLFHKPKSIGIAKEKDFDKKNPSLPSPSRGLLRSGFANASTTSLIDPLSSAAGSVYSSANTSTSTLVPVTTTGTGDKEKDKDKHRHHFLSRQKQKLKETTEHRALPLSSASSNSQAVDPSAPQSLYSFTPQSPGFSKSVSGLDLRHGGRALREKKKEEKAAAAATGLTPIMSNSSGNLLRDDSRSDFIGPSSLDSGSILGPPSNMSASLFAFPTLEQTPTISATAFSTLGSSMGLNGITADDAWPLLKARLLNVFGGEDLRTPIEDFNILVSVHIRRCIQKRAPVLLVEDLRELLTTGFSSLAQTLRGVPDERLVPKLVDTWQVVHASILPFIQAVFLPLDLEFRGKGTIMSSREAAEFWGGFIVASDTPKLSSSSFEEQRPSSAGTTTTNATTTTTTTANRMPSLGEELDVRRISIIVFRDVVLLPRHESLLAVFSRLSLDSMTSHPNSSFSPTRARGFSNPAAAGAERPSTGGSLSPRLSSFNSHNSNLMDAASSLSSGGVGGVTSTQEYPSRSRATSNTSAGSFGIGIHAHNMSIDSVTSALPTTATTTNAPTITSPISATSGFSENGMSVAAVAAAQQRLENTDPTKVTQTVARMLQCCSVVASVQTGDSAQGVVERLTRELKYNWLGRGRTGRQRRGWVGVKVGRDAGGSGVGVGVGVGA